MNMACNRVFCKLSASILSKNVRTIFGPSSVIGPVRPPTPEDEKKVEVNKPTHTGQVSADVC